MKPIHALSALLVIVLVACGNQTPPKADRSGSPSESAAAADRQSSATMTLNGAGATFPFPIYSKWAHMYNQSTGTRLNYQSIGSGGGIAQIKARTVDFGASDAPLEKAELDEAGLVQFPLVMGGVVLVVNLEGISSGQVKLSRGVLADIFLGKIKKWNHAAIKKDNPGLALPDGDISVVHRADGSGTTWIFTNYLARISEEWKTSVGSDKAVEWPTGMGGKGNEGVAAYVQRIRGAIGYVEFAYALQNNMTHVQLENADGTFVSPTIETFQAAAANADWANAPGFYMVLTNQPGAASWPITGASFILMYREQNRADTAKEALKFFDWCFTNGAAAAEELHYVPMPEAVANQVRALWKESIRSGGNPLWN